MLAPSWPGVCLSFHRSFITTCRRIEVDFGMRLSSTYPTLYVLVGYRSKGIRLSRKLRVSLTSGLYLSNTYWLHWHRWAQFAACLQWLPPVNLMRHTQQSGKREKQKANIRTYIYQELKAEVQRKLRVDKQQQLEGMCMELEAVNSKRNSRQLFQIVKSMTRKFQPRVSNCRKFDWSCRYPRQLERVLWRLVLWWGPNRTVKAGGESAGHNAQNICGDLENWWVATAMDVLHVHPTSQERRS